MTFEGCFCPVWLLKTKCCLLNLTGITSVGRRCKTSGRNVSTRREGNVMSTCGQCSHLFLNTFSSFADFLLQIQAETSWALTVLGYLAKLVLGILGWVLILYLVFWMVLLFLAFLLYFSGFTFHTFSGILQKLAIYSHVKHAKSYCILSSYESF